MATSASDSAHQARSLKTDEEIVAIRYGIKVVEEHFGSDMCRRSLVTEVNGCESPVIPTMTPLIWIDWDYK